MTNEYLLQKKTISGWSNVSWWSDYELANKNYLACSKGNSGYSWRLVEVKVVHECMLSEVVDVLAPIEPIGPIYSTNSINAKTGNWADGHTPKPVQVKRNGWGGHASNLTPERPSGDPGANATPSEGNLDPHPAHGLAGRVWMVHHRLEKKGRFAPELIDGMIAEGWERGGPRTQFREG